MAAFDNQFARRAQSADQRLLKRISRGAGRRFLPDLSGPAQQSKIVPIRFRVFLLVFLFLSFCWAPLRSQARAEAQSCPGSTVDLQGEKAAEKSRAFLAKLQSAVSDNDKDKVASMISYPLLVIRGTHKNRIKTRSQFLQHYNSIFDAHIRHTIARQSAQCLFGNYQGTMIGDGEIWYREQANGKMRIVTVNPTAGIENTAP